jgi:hypothetical protein
MNGGEFSLGGRAADIRRDSRFDAAYFGLHMPADGTS